MQQLTIFSFYHDFERDTELLEDYDKFVDNIQQKGEILDKSMATLLEKAMKKKVSIYLHLND